MIPTGSFQIWNSSNNVTIKSDIVVGQTLIFENGEESIELLVVGTFNTNEIAIPLDINSELWMVVDITTFEEMVDLYDGVIENAYVYSMSFTVPGEVLSQETYFAVGELNDLIAELLVNQADISIYGNWRSHFAPLPTQEAIDEADLIILSIQYAILGGVLLSTMFAYLISRFRRNEIAILKAMGYANRYVRATLIGEILTTSFVGFILGLGTVQARLFYVGDFRQSSLLSSQSILVSFGLIVVISIPGMLFVSQRILGISPAEAFRTK
jgi:ABC-type antimicrobial peptide transport system permease subunit